ncbi:MAG TPA: YlxR family protein, partial [Erythrobacter sp.]|nr:YlxR family protein [Erythrobacter sp.]
MRTPPNERLTSDIAEPALPASAGSERRCILSGEITEREGLLRLAISPDGLVLPDVAAKAPGRGAWLGVSRSELEAALTDGALRKGLMRAFKGAPLTIPDDLPERVEA